METQVKERLTGAIILVGVLVFLVPELLTGPKGGSRAPVQSTTTPEGPMRSYTIDLREGAQGRQATAPIPDAPAETAGSAVEDPLAADANREDGPAEAGQSETIDAGGAQVSSTEEPDGRAATRGLPAPFAQATPAPAVPPATGNKPSITRPPTATPDVQGSRASTATDTASSSSKPGASKPETVVEPSVAKPPSTQSAATRPAGPKPADTEAVPRPGATNQSGSQSAATNPPAPKPTDPGTLTRPGGTTASSAQSAATKPAAPKPRDAQSESPRPATTTASANIKPSATGQPAPQKPNATTPEGAKGWCVQVGSFASRANADRLASRLQSKGFKAFVSQGAGSRKLYRVRVGSETNRSAAQTLASRLKAAGHPGALVANP